MLTCLVAFSGILTERIVKISLPRALSRVGHGLSLVARSPRIRAHLPPPQNFQPSVPGLVRFGSSQAGTSVGVRPSLTHIDAQGRPSMVDVSSKAPSARTATASGRIYLPRVAYELIVPPPESSIPFTTPYAELDALEKAKAKARGKGDVLTVAQLAAIMACKRTADLIPLCHPLPLTHVAVTLTPETGCVGKEHEHAVLCEATVSCDGKTGVEMEALTAVSVGLLTVWDMLKAVAGREMLIGDICVTRKSGGKSGDFERGNSTL